MKWKKLYLGILVTLLISIVTFSYAELQIIKVPNEKDFKITFLAEKPVACSCSTFQDVLVITNSGDWPAIFTIITDPVMGISNNYFELWPNESKIIYISSQDKSCKEGSFTYNLKIKNNLGFEQEFRRTILLQKCNNLEVSLLSGKSKLLPCEEISYKIQVRNPSNFKDTYYVKLYGDAAPYFNISSEKFILLPKQSNNVVIKGSLACELYGNYTLGVEVRTERNNYVVDLPILLNVERAYEYDLMREDSPGKCNNKWENVRFYTTNKGAIENNYVIEPLGFVRTDELGNNSIEVFDETNDKLTKFLEKITTMSIIDSGSFLKEFMLTLDKNNFSLKPNESEKIVASFFVDKSLEGNYYLALRIVPKYGDYVKRVYIPFYVDRCYDYSIFIEDKPNVVDQNTYIAHVIIKNEGSKEDSYGLELNDYSYLTLGESYFTLLPGQSKVIDLMIDGTKAYSQFNETIKDVNVRVKSPNHYVVKESSFSFLLVSNYTATKVSMDKKSLVFWKEKDYDTITLIHEGHVPSNYLIKLEPYDLLILNSTNYVKLLPGESYKLKLGLNKENLKIGTYKVNVTIISLRNNVHYTYELTIHYTQAPLLVETYLYLKKHPCVAVTLALLLIFIITLIIYLRFRGKEVVWDKNVRAKAYFITLIIYIILFFALFAYTGIPKPYKPEFNMINPLYFEVPANENLTINLSKYFYDPDNDTLSYEVFVVSKSQGVEVKIENSTLLSWNEFNENAWLNFYVVATDPKGLNATSSMFSVKFLRVPHYNVYDYYLLYCQYINLAIAFIITLMLVRIFSKTGKKEKKRKSRRKRK